MISVIIPTYNRKELLMEALKSVLSQTFQDIEIIVVDDASTDGTESLLEGWGTHPLIRYIRLAQNSGVHVARNTGLEAAHGDEVLFLDSDDILYPDALAIAHTALASMHGSSIFTAPMHINDTQEITGFSFDALTKIPFEDILCNRYIRGQKNAVALIRRSVIAEHRFVMQNLDFIFYRKVIKAAGHALYYPKPLGSYRKNDSDRSSLHLLRRVPNERLSRMRAPHLADFLKEFLPDFEKNCIQCAAPYAYGASVGLLLNNNVPDAQHWARFYWRHTRNLKSLLLLLLVYMPKSNILLKAIFTLYRFGLTLTRKMQ